MQCSTIAWPWVFRVESCLWLRREFFRAKSCVLGTKYNTIVWSSTKCNTMACTIWVLILGTVPNIALWFAPATNYNTIASSSTKCDTMFLGLVMLSFGYGTKYNNILSRLLPLEYCGLRYPTPVPAPKYIKLVVTFAVPNVIIVIGLIQVTAPNTFPDSLFINLVSAYALFERSIDKEWHNSPGTSFDGRGDPLE